MTEEQFARWLDFSTRLSRHGWPNATDERKDKITRLVTDFISDYEHRKDEVEDWDGNKGEVYLCDEIDEFLDLVCHRHADPFKETRFESQISCCVRAGFDVAVEPSAGVVGFTVGTLRTMYDRDVPDWVSDWFDQSLDDTIADSEPTWL